jgi:Fe-S-cluster-containing dehydrogenase component
MPRCKRDLRLYKGTQIVTANIAAQDTLTPPASAQPRVARRWIAFDARWCRTCRVCETVCAIAHEGAARPALARIRVTFDEFPTDVPDALEEPDAARHFVSATVCLHCADAPCLDACPTRSLSRDARSGAILVDADPDSETVCIGCMRCRKACPWDVPVRHPEHKIAIVCDLCTGRKAGPVCVEMCPLSGKALRLAAAPEPIGHAGCVTPAQTVEVSR